MINRQLNQLHELNLKNVPNIGSVDATVDENVTIN